MQLVDERFNVEETKFKMLEGAVKNVVRDISLYLEKLDVSIGVDTVALCLPLCFHSGQVLPTP